MTRKDFIRAVESAMALPREEDRDVAVTLFINFFSEERNFDEARFIQAVNEAERKLAEDDKK